MRIRASSSLFRLKSAAAIRERLTFYNTGPTQVPTLLVGHLDGTGLSDATFRELIYLINVGATAQRLEIPALRRKPFVLHPVHLTPGASDSRVAREALYEPEDGRFTVPARAAVVFVAPD